MKSFCHARRIQSKAAVASGRGIQCSTSYASSILMVARRHATVSSGLIRCREPIQSARNPVSTILWKWLIALSPQPQHVDFRRKRAFGLENSVGMIGVRPFRPASGAISKDPLAIRRRNANSSARPPSGAGSLRVRAARSEAASGQGSAAAVSFQVAGPDARPASSSANRLSPRRRRQFHRNDHSTSCRSRCLHRNPCRTPRPRRLRFENTRWIHSRTSCAGLPPTAIAVWFSSPS